MKHLSDHFGWKAVALDLRILTSIHLFGILQIVDICPLKYYLSKGLVVPEECWPITWV